MKKNVQNLMKCTKTKNQRKGFLRTTALMMAFMLLLGSVDVSVFAAQEDNNAKVQEANIQPEENADNTAADSTAVVPEKTDDTLSDEDAELKEADSEKESEKTLSTEEPSDTNEKVDSEEDDTEEVDNINKDDTQMEDENEKDSDIENLQERINELPTVEEVQLMSETERNEVYENAQKLFEEYDVLSELGQKLVDIGKLEKLFEYFNSQISVNDVSTTGNYSYEPITINKSTLNGSTVWGIGDTQFTMDKDGGFFSSDKQSAGAFPDDGKIVTSDNVPYQLSWTGAYKYSGNDSIRLAGKKYGSSLTSDKVTMNLLSYGAYDKIFVLGTAGGFEDNTKSLNFTVTLTYTDGTKSETTYNLYDWYQKTSIVLNYVNGYGIYKRLNNNGYTIDKDYGTNGGPMVQSKAIECDASKLLKSISFQITNTDASVANSNGIYSAIYAVTGAISNSAPQAPQGLSAEEITNNGFTATWNKTSNAAGYYIDISEYESFYDSNGNPSFVDKYNNFKITDNRCKIEGLERGKTYYYRVRAFGNGAQSISSNVAEVTTLYTARIVKKDKTIQYYDSLDEAIKAAEAGDEIIVDGKADTEPTITENVTLNENVKLTIPENKTVTMTDNASLSVNGELGNSGTLAVNSGASINNSGLISGAGNIQNEGNVTNSEKGTFKTSVANKSTGTFTNEANSSWKESGSDKTYYGPLDAALKETESKKTEITVSKDAEINGKVTLGNGSTLKVTGNTTVNVTENGSITNNGTLDITNGSSMTNAGAITGTGSIENKGTVVNEKTGAILSGVTSSETGNVINRNDSQWTVTGEDGKIFYGSLDGALENTQDKTADITLENDAAISGNKTLGDNVSLNVPSDKTLTISDNGSLTISDKGSLNVEGSVDVSKNGGITNEGTLDIAQNGNMSNAGAITGTGSIANKGTVVNEETGAILSGVTSTDNGTVENRNNSHWTVNEQEDKIYYGSLDTALDEARDKNEKTDITLDKNAELSDNNEIGSNVSVTVPEDKTLTIPEDKVLTVSKDGQLNMDGSLQVKQNGTLENNGNVSVDENGSITNAGTIIGDTSATIKNEGQIYNNSTGTILSDIDTDKSKNPDADVTNFNEASWTVTDKENGKQQTYYGSLSDAANDANQKSEEITETGDKKYDSVIRIDTDTKLNNDITLKDGVDLVVPDGTTVTVPENTKLTISEGASLDNEGTLDIKNTGALEIEGTLNVDETGNISNNGELSGTGDVENKGSIVNEKNGTVKADKLENVDNGTFKNKNDVSLTDKDGKVYYYSSLDEALKDAKSMDGEVTIDIGSRVNPTISGTAVEIPENVTIVIPENKLLTIASGTELEVRGKIENKGTILNTGALTLIPESNLSGTGTLTNSSGASWKNTDTDMAYYGPFKDAVKKAGEQETSEGTDIEITLERDTEITEDVTIPENITVAIPKDKSLTVQAPASLNVEGNLKNEGNLNVSEGAGLNVSGKLDNDGNLQLVGNANLNVKGEFNNNGNVSSEAQWKDENGEIHYGSLKDALASGAKDIELKKDVTLTENTVIPEDVKVSIKDGATITVPKDKYLEIKGTLEGADENTVINQNEASCKNPETGKGYYGSLEETIKKAQEVGSSEIKLDQDATISNEVTIPSNITVVVPKNKKLEVNGTLNVEGKLDNAGTVDIKGNAEVATSGTFTNKGTVDIEGTTTVAGTLENQGIVDIKGTTTVTGTLDNKGTVDIEGTTTVTGTLNNQGTGNIDLEKDSTLDVSGKLDNAGKVDLKDGSEMKISGTLENKKDGNISTEGNAKVTVPEGIANSVNSSAEAQWTDSAGTHFGTLNEALESRAENITLNNNATLTEDTVIPDNVTITVKPGATITVPKDKSLEIKGTLEGADENTIINWNEASCKNPETGKGYYYGSLEKTIEKASEIGSSEIKLDQDATISNDVTIPSNITVVVPENKKLEVNGKLNVAGKLDNAGTVDIKGNAEVAASGTFTNQGTVDIEGTTTVAGTLDNQRTVDIKGTTTVTGTLNNQGNIDLEKDSTLEVLGKLDNTGKVDLKDGSTMNISGKLENNGNVLTEGNAKVTVPAGTADSVNSSAEAQWTDKDDNIHFGTLNEALNENKKGNVKDNITLNNNATLTENTEIPDGVTIIVNKNATITVPEGKSLEVNGTLSGADENTIINQNEASWKNPDTKNEYYGSLEDALEKAKNQGDSEIEIKLDQNATIGDVTIPENITVIVPKNKKLEVNGTLNVEGKLENQGNIDLEKDSTLNVSESGKLDNAGKVDLKDGSEMNISGTLENKKDGNISAEGNAKVTVPAGTADYVNSSAEAQWRDSKGNTHFGTLNEALESAAENITLNNNATLTEDTVIPDNVKITVTPGVTITVPEDKSLEVNGKLSGADDNTIINQNEASWKNPETGEQYCGNLNEALTKANDPENKTSHITVNKDATLDTSKNSEIPAGVTVDVDKNANLIISGDNKLTVAGEIQNKGTITVDAGTSLEVTVPGKLENETGSSVENKNEAHWIDPVTGNAYYGTLDEVLEKANEKATAENPATVVIDHNTTLKSDMKFDNINLDVNEDAEISIENGVSVPEDVVNKIEKNNECTWTDNNGTHYGSLENALNNQTSGTIKVNKDAEIKGDITIAPNVTIEVPKDKTITVAKDATMTIEGKIQNDGTIETEGTIEVTGNLKNTGTIKTTGEMTITGALENTGMLKNEGTMNVSGNVTNKGTIANLDVITNNENGSIINASGAKIKGSGSIENNGNMSNKGEISVEGTVADNGKVNGKITNKDLESTLTKDHEYEPWEIDVEPTATQEGRKHRKCKEHGEIVYQTIPATGAGIETSSGKSYKEVLRKQELGTFGTNLNNSKQELVDGLLNEGEKEDIDTFGSSAYIWLDVAPNVDVSTSDKEVIQKTAKTLGDNVGVEYNEISLYKRVGFEKEQKITDTNDLEISITIDIPEKLTEYDKNKVVRKFYMLRAHEGEGTVIDNGVLSEDGTQFTFTTTKFSTYALAYMDSEKTSGGSDPVTPVQPGKPGTSENPGKPGTSENPGKSDDAGKTEGGASTGSNNNSNVSGDNASDSNSGNQTNGTGTSIESQNGSNGTAIVGKTNMSVDKKNNKKSSDVKADSSKENGKTPEQIASATDDSKKDNNSNESGSDSSKDSKDVEKADTGHTSVAETIKKPSKQTEKQLKDALSQIKKLDSKIQPGPYIQINESEKNTSDNAADSKDGKVKFTLNIPEDIAADGRVFYLITVDSEGNIVVLQNESTEAGVFSAAGDPDATYQIVYEDGESTLADLVSENGILLDADGNTISVKAEQSCFWHWIIAVVALIGIVLALLARKKKYAIIIAAIDTVLMLICVILGSCRWDIVTMLIGVVLLVAVTMIRIRRTSRTAR